MRNVAGPQASVGFIREPIRLPQRSPKGFKKKTARATDKNSVFVVHGRDEKLRKSLYAFLRTVGLKPLEWEHAILQAKDVNPHVDAVLDVAMGKVQAVVILFSPDDDAMLNPKLWGKNEPAVEKRLSGQPRANVLFEAGMALARHPGKTLILQVGKVRGFSDIAGRHVVRLNDSKEKRNDVLNRLEKIGCKIDRQGTDWMSEGDFVATRERR
jgi:predicted nucleotide-binding protein